MSPPPLDMNAYCCTLLTAANAAAHAASVARADAAFVASGSAAAGVPEGGFVAPYNLSALTLNADDRHTEAPEEVEQGWLKLGSLILSCYESASDASRLAAVTNGLGHSIIRNLLTVEANLSVNVRQSIETKYKAIEGDGLPALTLEGYRGFSEDLIDWNEALATGVRHPQSTMALKLAAAVRNFGNDVATKLDVELRLTGAVSVADVEAVLLTVVSDFESTTSGRGHHAPGKGGDPPPEEGAGHQGRGGDGGRGRGNGGRGNGKKDPNSRTKPTAWSADLRVCRYHRFTSGKCNGVQAERNGFVCLLQDSHSKHAFWSPRGAPTPGVLCG